MHFETPSRKRAHNTGAAKETANGRRDSYTVDGWEI